MIAIKKWTTRCEDPQYNDEDLEITIENVGDPERNHLTIGTLNLSVAQTNFLMRHLAMLNAEFGAAEQ